MKLHFDSYEKWLNEIKSLQLPSDELVPLIGKPIDKQIILSHKLEVCMCLVKLYKYDEIIRLYNYSQPKQFYESVPLEGNFIVTAVKLKYCDSLKCIIAATSSTSQIISSSANDSEQQEQQEQPLQQNIMQDSKINDNGFIVNLREFFLNEELVKQPGLALQLINQRVQNIVLKEFKGIIIYSKPTKENSILTIKVADQVDYVSIDVLYKGKESAILAKYQVGNKVVLRNLQKQKKPLSNYYRIYDNAQQISGKGEILQEGLSLIQYNLRIREKHMNMKYSLLKDEVQLYTIDRKVRKYKVDVCTIYIYINYLLVDLNLICVFFVSMS